MVRAHYKDVPWSAPARSVSSTSHCPATPGQQTQDLTVGLGLSGDHPSGARDEEIWVDLLSLLPP